MSWYKSDSQCRREGERKFERNRYARDQNPYPDYGSYDDSRHRRAWADGFRSAEHRDEERCAEEAADERRAQQRAHEIEMQRQAQMEEAWAEQEEEREREEEDYVETPQ